MLYVLKLLYKNYNNNTNIYLGFNKIVYFKKVYPNLKKTIFHHEFQNDYFKNKFKILKFLFVSL